MIYKHYLHGTCLFIWLLLSSLSYGQSFKVELSEAYGHGVSPDMVQINHIRVILQAPIEQAGVVIYYNILFKACQFDYSRQYLVPILYESQQIDCLASERDFSQSEVSNLGLDRILLKVNPLDPATRIVLRFYPDTLQLMSIIPTPPRYIRILLSWGKQPYDLDAHLTGPAPGLSASYKNEPDRFHVYFGNKNSDVSIIYTNMFNDTQPEEVVIFPPPGQQTLRAGIYRFTVHNFAGGDNIAQSGAQTYLWLEDSPAQLFTPPLVETGNFSGENMDSWVVFELHVTNDGMVTVVPIQRYDWQINPSELRIGLSSG